MASGAQSPLYTIISLSLIVSGLVIVGLVSGLIPRMIPAQPGADEPAVRLEAQAEAVSATGAAAGNPVSPAVADPRAAADQAGNSGAESPALLAEARPKNP